MSQYLRATVTIMIPAFTGVLETECSIHNKHFVQTVHYELRLLVILVLTYTILHLTHYGYHTVQDKQYPEVPVPVYVPGSHDQSVDYSFVLGLL